jgi:hypothetical protein
MGDRMGIPWRYHGDIMGILWGYNGIYIYTYIAGMSWNVIGYEAKKSEFSACFFFDFPIQGRPGFQ